MPKATIYDVAGAAKVSLATVSRVLNCPEKVNVKTRTRVLEVIKELGYRPNAIARGLASKKTTSIGIVVSDITRASTGHLLAGIFQSARTYGYSAKLFPLNGDEELNETIKIIISEQVDGVLFLSDEVGNDEMNELRERFGELNIPLVLANTVSDDELTPSVSIDYELASYELTKQLIQKGRKDIYLLTSSVQYGINQKKELGYTRAMKEFGFEPKTFKMSGRNLEKSAQLVKDYFANNKVDAAIGVRDSFAINFLNTMLDQGYSIPENLEVCGFQNTRYAMLSRPSLTCVDTPVYDIGAKAMSLLTQYMKQEEVEDHTIVLDYSIVKRNSTL